MSTISLQAALANAVAVQRPLLVITAPGRTGGGLMPYMGCRHKDWPLREISWAEFETLVAEAKAICGGVRQATQLPDVSALPGVHSATIRWLSLNAGHEDAFAVSLTFKVVPDAEQVSTIQG